MNIIFIKKRGTHVGTVSLTSGHIIGAAVLLLALVPGAFVAGSYLGVDGVMDAPHLLVKSWKQQMDQQREEIARVNADARENIDALAMRLGQLQAHVIRLDALGSRLTKMARLEKGEFDFESSPAQGGPAEEGVASSMHGPDLAAAIDTLSLQLEDRAQQLELLETMLMNRNLQSEVVPAGRPVSGGWLSSYYGKRADPFTGRLMHHDGVDFAGKEGSEVMSVAAGVVTWSGSRFGYGNLVEINHGNGYSTRYAHNGELLVSVGDTVRKGQTIALMGSTGRSTGPHVHFEVLLNGKQVNPSSYIQAAR